MPVPSPRRFAPALLFAVLMAPLAPGAASVAEEWVPDEVRSSSRFT
jgi:hypothetical protein